MPFLSIGIEKAFTNMKEILCDALQDLVHLHNLKNVKNTHGVVLLLVKLQALPYNDDEENYSG